MDWFTDRASFGLAVGIYAGCTVYALFLWRRGFRRDDWIGYLLLLLGFAFHTTAMIKRGFSLAERCPVTNLYEAMAFISWTIVASYLVVGLWRRLRFLSAFTAPLLLALGVFALQPKLDEAAPRPQFDHGGVSLHAALVLLAYGAFGLSSVAALMYLSQEHDLKFRKLRAVLSQLPPIQRLERITAGLLVAGLVFLTLGLAMSPFLMRARYGVFLSTDPKIVWSAVIWCLYTGLLVLWWRFDAGGRRLAWGVVGSFAFLILTFWGTNLLSAVHQH